MKKIKMMVMTTVAMLLVAASNVLAAPDYADLSTAVTEGATAATAVVTVAIIAGFGIYVLIWGARKIKSGLGG